ncbi:MAG: dockerin type I domain-containing protein, partial [Singulisphaera sp.]
SWLHTGVGLQSGDVNGDGIVNGQDLALISSNWLQTGGAPGSGSGSGSSLAAVPEPASCVLCAIGAVVGLLLWRRKDR